jgi:hypothetical protein
MSANPSSQGVAPAEPGARCERRGGAGFILLDPPKALEERAIAAYFAPIGAEASTFPEAAR